MTYRPQSLPAPMAGPRPFQSGPQVQQGPGGQGPPAPNPMSHPQAMPGPRPQDPRQVAHPQPQGAPFDPRHQMPIQMVSTSIARLSRGASQTLSLSSRRIKPFIIKMDSNLLSMRVRHVGCKSWMLSAPSCMSKIDAMIGWGD